jgi:hypothetical protein
MTPTEMKTRLAAVGARAKPIIPEGWSVPNGYTLHGPRGTKGCVTLDADGNVRDFYVRLFCDGIADGNQRAAERRARRAGKP